MRVNMKLRQEIEGSVHVLRLMALREVVHCRLKDGACLAQTTRCAVEKGETCSSSKLPGFRAVASGNVE